MTKNVIVVALALTFAQGSFAQVKAGSIATVAKLTEARVIDQAKLEKTAAEGKTPQQKRNLVIEAYGQDAGIKKAAADMKVDATDLLAHLATNTDAVETVNYTARILADNKASALDKRAADASAKILRTIARNSALSAKDQADIAATRKAVTLGSKVAEYGDTSVVWFETMAKRMSEGVQANVALRNASTQVLKLEGKALETFMSSRPEDMENSLLGCIR